MNFEEFNARILNPSVLKGIESGQFDNVLYHCLFETEIEFDEKTLRAIINRLRKLKE